MSNVVADTTARVDLIECMRNRNLDGIEIDRRHYEGRKRRWQQCQELSPELDRWPIAADFPCDPDSNYYPSVEESQSPEFLLWNSIHRVVKCALVDDDSLPVMWLRSREITNHIPRAFGVPVYPDESSPQQLIPSIADLESLEKLQPIDVSKSEACRESFDIIKWVQEALGQRAYVTSTTTTGGPFSIASMMMDNLLFYESVLSNPEPMKRLLDIVLDAMVQYRNLEADVLNYPADEGYTGWGTFQPGGVWRLWDASGMMVSPESYLEFCVPYWEKLFALFGGGARQLSPGDERYLAQILRTKGLKIIRPERTPDFDIRETTRMAIEKNVMVEWTNWDHIITSVAEFEDWIDYIRKETGNPGTGIALIVSFATCDIARECMSRWKELN